MDVLARWWDSVELWLTGLPFAPQVSLILIALALIAIVVVRVLTVLIDVVAGAARDPAEPAEDQVKAGRKAADEERSGV